MTPTFIIIDLFCGAGGTTTGFSMTGGISKVIACINHDHLAIKSHWENHPEVQHFNEDIRTLDLTELTSLLVKYKLQFPHAYVVLWASLECTNFSKAKGGLPRDADSRTLAEHLFRYVEKLNPDYVMIENVVEFKAWGPLDEKGKPLSMHKGEDFMKWRSTMCDTYAYYDEWKEMNSANYGAYTSRNRLFGCFAATHLPITFPLPTHSKKGELTLKKWEAVKNVLQMDEHGTSIFNRKKPLVEKTLERIYAGLVKFVSNPFISNYKSGNPKGMNTTTENPCGTLTTVPTQAVVTPFLLKYNSTNAKTGKYVPPSIEHPAPVISTQGRFNICNAHFISPYFGNSTPSSVEKPATTLTTKDRLSLCTAFINREFTSPSYNSSIEEPAGALLTTPKINLVSVEHWILNRQFNNKGNSVTMPSPTLIATLHKRPLYLVSVERGVISIITYNDDSPMMRQIKSFMRTHGLFDIKMRMLFISELKRIQGFPNDYVLLGTQADQKKYIGNSVVPQVVKAWIECLHAELNTLKIKTT